MEGTLKNNTSKQLLWIGMIGITMFFAGLTSAVIVRSADSGWESIIMPQWFWYSTFAIVLSSITLMIAKRQVKKGISPTFYIVSSLILGLLFSCVCSIFISKIYFKLYSKKTNKYNHNTSKKCQ